MSIYGIEKGEEYTMKSYCDNTDCVHYDKQELFLVFLREEFDGNTCHWCMDCIDKDSDMIDKVKYNYNTKNQKL